MILNKLNKLNFEINNIYFKILRYTKCNTIIKIHSDKVMALTELEPKERLLNNYNTL